MKRDSERLPRPEAFGDFVRLYFTGFAMGAADIVPGVSGGTMAFILGVYEDLIHSIKSFGAKALIFFVNREFAKLFRYLPIAFLMALGTGVLSAVVILSSVLSHLLDTEPTYLFTFFGGLILASIFAIGAKVRWGLASILSCIVTAAFGFWLVGMTPGGAAAASHDPLTLFLCGAVAICAMILPGISGSFILLILGQYEFILEAVHARDFVSLFFVAAGCGIGIMVFSRLLSALLRQAYEVTIAALTGFMIGSIRLIWIRAVDGMALFPEFGLSEQLMVGALLFSGFFIVCILDHLQTRENPVLRLFWRSKLPIAA